MVLFLSLGPSCKVDQYGELIFPTSLPQTDPMDDPFEDAELEALPLYDLAVTWSALRQHFLLTVFGRQPSPTRTANILHVLASVTVSPIG